MDWKKRARFGALALGIMVLAAAALSSGSALAAKGGGGDAGTTGGKGGGKHTTPPPSTAVCWVSPNPATLWGNITINGSGFTPNASFGYVLDGSWVGFVVADPNGNFSKVAVAPLSGTNTVNFTDVTSCTFQVN
jgi:hypothetical protein